MIPVGVFTFILFTCIGIGFCLGYLIALHWAQKSIKKMRDEIDKFKETYGIK